MKKIYLTLLVLLFVKGATAQLTLTKAFNGPVSGDVDNDNYYDTTSVISQATGTNKVWNYSSVVLNPTNGANNTTYTLASSVAGVTAAFPTASLVSFSPPQNSTTSYDVIKSNSSNEEFLGSYSTTQPITFSNTLIYYNYPFTFGSANTDTYAFSIASSSVTQTGTVTVTGSGTGTLILPGNLTYANCLQIKLTTVASSTVAGTPYSSTLTLLTYFHASQKFALATFSYQKNNNSTSVNNFNFVISNNVIPVGIKVNSDNSATFNLYPNPAKDKINISGDVSTKNIEVIITDITGKIIKTEMVNTDLEKSVNVADLEKGIYTLTIKSNGVYSRNKFIKD